MAMKKPVVAICYDFDGTLSPGNMQEYGFFSGLGKEAKNFWKESAKLAEDNSADPVLTYMKLMIQKARIGDIGTTRKAFGEYGKSVTLFAGVEEWFDRISEYGKEKGISIEHYIVSSGLKEIIIGTTIAKYFKKIYACSFFYDHNDAAEWPAVAVNYTTKTQFLFRINKGIEDDNDHKKINEYIHEDERRIPFLRMIYIGDGDTDIPCMRLVKAMGGYAIVVYDPNRRGRKKESEKLLKDGRVNFVSAANYRINSRMDKLVCAILDKIAATTQLSKLNPKLSKTKQAAVGRNKETQ